MSSKSYPIWNQVQACIYKSDKSYGVRNEGVVNVKVGTSRTYSYDFVKHVTTVKDIDKHTKEYRFYVDNNLIKQATFNTKTKEFKIKCVLTTLKEIDLNKLKEEGAK